MNRHNLEYLDIETGEKANLLHDVIDSVANVRMQRGVEESYTYHGWKFAPHDVMALYSSRIILNRLFGDPLRNLSDSRLWAHERMKNKGKRQKLQKLLQQADDNVTIVTTVKRSERPRGASSDRRLVNDAISGYFEASALQDATRHDMGFDHKYVAENIVKYVPVIKDAWFRFKRNGKGFGVIDAMCDEVQEMPQKMCDKVDKYRALRTQYLNSKDVQARIETKEKMQVLYDSIRTEKKDFEDKKMFGKDDSQARAN